MYNIAGISQTLKVLFSINIGKRVEANLYKVIPLLHFFKFWDRNQKFDISASSASYIFGLQKGAKLEIKTRFGLISQDCRGVVDMNAVVFAWDGMWSANLRHKH